ncbi:elongation factor Tu GTP binding domain-containing protein, partial [Colletotrichum scovillei]
GGADDDAAAEVLVRGGAHLLGANNGLAVGNDGGAGLDVAAGEALLEIRETALKVQLAGGKEDVLAAAELLVLCAGVGLDEEAEAVDHLVEVAAHEHVERRDGDLLRRGLSIGVGGRPFGRDDPEAVADGEGA